MNFFAILFFLTVTCIYADYRSCQLKEAITENQNASVNSEKAFEKQKFQQHVLDLFGALENFERIDSELNMRLKKINKLKQLIFACDVGLVVCFGVMIYCVKKIKS